jgi:hypothetical protein
MSNISWNIDYNFILYKAYIIIIFLYNRFLGTFEEKHAGAKQDTSEDFAVFFPAAGIENIRTEIFFHFLMENRKNKQIITG